jgi:hypothetical protein
LRDGWSDVTGGVQLGLVLSVVAAEELAVKHADDITADFVGIAMREEFGLDVRTLSPTPEQLLHLLYSERFWWEMGSPPNWLAMMAWTSGRPFSQGRRTSQFSPSARRWLTCSRISFGRRVILPVINGTGVE